MPLALEEAFAPDAAGWRDTGRTVDSVYIHAGENGLFARDEFETISSLGQMEFITPEEVADYVVMELEGRPTGRDIVAALDSATAGPTYRAAILRSAAIERLKQLEAEHGVRSIAFEMLGPPRLSRMLYEAFLWSLLRDSVQALADSDPDQLSRDAAQLIARDAEVRSTILSVGLPILVSDREVYRGAEVLVPPADGDLDQTVRRGWVDVRPANCAVWIDRARRIVEQARTTSASGSGVDWGAMKPSDAVSPSRMATWIFGNEDDGERIKR
jgi:hypothetical protein